MIAYITSETGSIKHGRYAFYTVLYLLYLFSHLSIMKIFNKKLHTVHTPQNTTETSGNKHLK